MHIVTRKHLLDSEARYPDVATALRAWYKIAASARWRTLVEIRQSFQDADSVDEFVVFNVRHNRYRLITIVHYSPERNGRLTEGHLYIRSFLTHKDYNNKANWNKGVWQ
jgi:mRNA interferase HigB